MTTPPDSPRTLVPARFFLLLRQALGAKCCSDGALPLPQIGPPHTPPRSRPQSTTLSRRYVFARSPAPPWAVCRPARRAIKGVRCRKRVTCACEGWRMAFKSNLGAGELRCILFRGVQCGLGATGGPGEGKNAGSRPGRFENSWGSCCGGNFSRFGPVWVRSRAASRRRSGSSRVVWVGRGC